MEKRNRHAVFSFVVLVLSAALPALLAGCGGSGDSNPTGPETPDAVQVTIGDASTAEGDAGTCTLDFDVSISAAPETGSVISCDWTTIDGTATSGDGDYTSDSGTLTFVLGGSLTQQIAILVKGDLDVEADETIQVVLSNVSNAEFFDALGTGTIVNDDVAGSSGDLLVDPSSPGTEDGLTWATAFHTIQAAVEASFGEGGGEIWVAAATYVSGSVDFDVPVVLMRQDVRLYGGFEGYADGSGALETERSQRDPDANVTRLDGLGVARHVVHSQTVSGAVLDGFTVTGGNADGGYGGGLYMNHSAVMVAQCLFSGNNAGWGAGIYITDASPAVTGCTFRDNTARYGGGIYCYRSSASVTDCRFIDNTTTNCGGGMYAADDSNPDSVPVLLGCTFTGNTAGSGSGGGLYVDYAFPLLTACTFSNNTAGIGGGIYFRNSSPILTTCSFAANDGSVEGGGICNYRALPELVDCTFTENEASRGGGIYNCQTSSVTLTGCDFSGNEARVSHGGGIYNSTGNVSNLTECTLVANTAVDCGGGVYNYGAVSSFTGCRFSLNTAGGKGGGMYNDYYASAAIEDSRFTENHAVDGGGIYNDRGSCPTITNCIFDSNIAVGGAGMFNADSSHAILANCIFTLNSASDSGGGLSNSHSSPKLSNCILYDNATLCIYAEIANDPTSNPRFSHCNIFACDGSDAWLSIFGIDDGGNIDVAPLFVDAAGGDFKLQAASPCIDAGNNVDLYDVDGDADVSELLMMSFDYYGNARFLDDPATVDTGSGTAPVIDMGVHEYQL